jgi:hypothetical protein
MFRQSVRSSCEQSVQVHVIVSVVVMDKLVLQGR